MGRRRAAKDTHGQEEGPLPSGGRPWRPSGTNGEKHGELRETGAELSGPAAGMDGREKVWGEEGSRVALALGFGDFGICYSLCWKRLVTLVSLQSSTKEG